MVILGVLLYLIFISLILFFSKRKTKDIILKNKKRINNLVISKAKFFINKNNAFYLYQSLLNGLVVFENLQKYNQLLKTFSDCGIDSSLPIYKLECYEKILNTQKLYKTLKDVKVLDNNKIEINFFVFYNNDKFLKPITKLIKYFCFKNIKVRIYNCVQIDYKLLSFINLLDLNTQNQILKNKINTHKKQELKNVLKNSFDNSVIKNLPTTKKIEGLFFYSNNSAFYENKYQFLNLTGQSFLTKNNFEIKTNKAFNFNFSTTIYKVEVKNTLNTMQTLFCCFGTVFKNKTLKNSIYFVNKNKDRLSLINTLQNKNLCIIGNFEKHFCKKDYFYALKKLVLSPNQTQTFFFCVCSEKNILNGNLLNLTSNNLENFYNTTLQDYSKINLPKILSQNKVLNYLINDCLPNKIISECILSNTKTYDFDALLNKKFETSLIDKNVCNKNLKSYFLLSQNYFKVYFNLFYFYLGFWQGENGLNINKDKSYVLNTANVFIKNKLLPFKINVKNSNLKNEIEVNNVKFTNLNKLNINSFLDKNLNLHF